MDYYSYLATAQDSIAADPSDLGNRRLELGRKFIEGAKEIGKRYSCFYEAVIDDDALYIQLKPALDFSKSYGWQPSNKERVEEFKKFRKEIDELAEKVGCKRTQYLWDPNVKTLSDKDEGGRDYMNSLVTSVKESVLKGGD